MILTSEMFNDPAWLLIVLGGLVTFVMSVLIAIDSFTAGPEPPRDQTGDRAREEEQPAERPRRSFVFIGFIAFPVFLGGFWGGGPRRRALGVFYLAGLLMAAAGVLLLVLR